MGLPAMSSSLVLLRVLNPSLHPFPAPQLKLGSRPTPKYQRGTQLSRRRTSISIREVSSSHDVKVELFQPDSLPQNRPFPRPSVAAVRGNG